MHTHACCAAAQGLALHVAQSAAALHAHPCMLRSWRAPAEWVSSRCIGSTRTVQLQLECSCRVQQRLWRGAAVRRRVSTVRKSQSMTSQRGAARVPRRGGHRCPQSSTEGWPQVLRRYRACGWRRCAAFTRPRPTQPPSCGAAARVWTQSSCPSTSKRTLRPQRCACGHGISHGHCT
jgi:hypothetical protein